MNKDCKVIEVKLNGKNIACEMPQGEWLGKSVSYVVEK